MSFMGSGKPFSRMGSVAIFAIGCAFFAGGCATSPAGRFAEAPLLRSSGSDGRKVVSVRTFGPFYERVETADGAVSESFRPLLWTHMAAADGEASADEILWPLSSISRRRGDVAWRVALFAGRDDGDSADRRTWLFPFWFSGTTDDGEAYRAFFPLGGTWRDAWWNSISFVLFPFSVSWDRGDLHTDSWLWPLVMHQRGTTLGGRDREAWRIFPFWSHTVEEGRLDARYVCWPFWTEATHGGINPGTEWMLWPLVGRVDRDLESAVLFLPPFFQFAYGRGDWAWDPDGEGPGGYRKILCPWPLVRIEDARSRHARAFFPFWSKRWTDDGGLVSHRILWPFWSDRTAVSGGRRAREEGLFPFYRRVHVEAAVAGTNGAPTLVEDSLRIWPFCSVRSDATRSLVRVPDPTLSRNGSAIDRNLLRIFTLYERGADETEVAHRLLWGLYQRRASRDPDGMRSWSVLGGLLGRSRDATNACLRVLWIPFRTRTNGGEKGEAR